MNKYTIYCTEEQTKKALELGAPLKFTEEGRGTPECCVYIPQKWGYYTIPTAEQMIGWLEEQIDDIDVLKNNNGKWLYLFYPTSNSSTYECEDKFLSRKEATLAAVDAALDYLKKKTE